MFNFFEYPLKSAIFIYLILITIIILAKPKLLNTQNSKVKCLLPIVIILVASLSYYLFAMVGWFNS